MTPPLIVFPRRALKGVHKHDPAGRPLDDRGTPAMGAHCQPDGWAAWQEAYPTDAHCVAYAIPRLIGKIHPRIKKRTLRYLMDHDAEPLLYWLIVDVDNRDHKPWPAGRDAWALQVVRGWIAHLEEETPSVYLTRAGYRLVWPIDTPVPVSECEPLIRGLLFQLVQQGIAADPRCRDWTRLFRMPRVVRDNALQTLPMEFTQ